MSGSTNVGTISTGGAPWAISSEETARQTQTDVRAGLSDSEAAARLQQFGANELNSMTGPGALAVFATQFKSVIIWVLITAAVVSGALGEEADAIAIVAIVFLNALFGFYQEFRAERALASLRQMAAPNARVLRNGGAAVIPVSQIVPGDFLLLESGDIAGADARLLESTSLRIVESSLTGESEPVDKDARVSLSPSTPLAERRNMVFMGTSIAGGSGTALVVATGSSTEMGRIASMLAGAGRQRTPLQERLDRVGRSLLYASLAVVVMVFLLGLARGEAPFEMLLTAVSLAVAAIPEGLPAVVTITLALGVGRMAKRHALVRRLPAVETLGSTQVICTDKTGTLTRGEMTVRVLWIGGREVEVTGEGYRAEGEFREGESPIDPEADESVQALLFAGAASSDAHLREDGALVGDPTEGAVLAAAAKGGIRKPELEAGHARLRTIPFDADRKLMTIIRDAQGIAKVFTKGAPELLLDRCDSWIGPGGHPERLTTEARQRIREANETLASRAFRVLAAATREATHENARNQGVESIESGLTLLGLVAMYDPPRAEAREAVTKCRKAGIRVVMITGDHPSTAKSIAGDLGILGEKDRVVGGAEVQTMSAEDLANSVDRISVYARVTAEDKLRIVRAFRAKGRIVAMTGDGVNDAPAVKEADIGVAMGITGTEVTKEASSMVITDDDFASIVSAVEEGRAIFANIKKCLLYLLSGNAAEILLVLAAVLIGWPVPLLPLHLLWINLATDGLPALALAADRAEPGLLRRPPRDPSARITDRGFIQTMVFSGVLTAAVALAAFWWGYRVAGNLELARTLAFSALVFSELLKSFSFRSLRSPIWAAGSSVNPRLVAVVVVSMLLQLAILGVPALRSWFQVSKVAPGAIGALFVLGAIPLVSLEARKVVVKRWSNRRTPPDRNTGSPPGSQLSPTRIPTRGLQ